MFSGSFEGQTNLARCARTAPVPGFRPGWAGCGITRGHRRRASLVGHVGQPTNLDDVHSDFVDEVSAAQAVELLDENALLLDVREADEWDAGHAPQAVHIPMSELNRRADELPTDRTIV